LKIKYLGGFEMSIKEIERIESPTHEMSVVPTAPMQPSVLDSSEHSSNDTINTASMQYVENVIVNAEPNWAAKLSTKWRNFRFSLRVAKDAFIARTQATKSHYNKEKTKAMIKDAKISKELLPLQREVKIIERQVMQDERMDRRSELYKLMALLMTLFSAIVTIIGVANFEKNGLIKGSIYAAIILLIQISLYLVSADETYNMRRHKEDYTVPYICKWALYLTSVYGTFKFLTIIAPPENFLETVIEFAISVFFDLLAFSMSRLATNVYFKNNTNTAKEMSILRDTTKTFGSIKNKIIDIKNKMVEVKTAQRPLEIDKKDPNKETLVTISRAESLEQKLVKQSKPKTPSKPKKETENKPSKYSRDINVLLEKAKKTISEKPSKFKITKSTIGFQLSDAEWKKLKLLLIENGLVDVENRICYTK
jgi:hypothetical protein